VCEGTARADYSGGGVARDLTTAVEILRRLEALPPGWREEAVRAVLLEVTSAVGTVQMTMNHLRARGIDTDVGAEGADLGTGLREVS
jgi:hypothetical protein